MDSSSLALSLVRVVVALFPCWLKSKEQGLGRPIDQSGACINYLGHRSNRRCGRRAWSWGGLAPQSIPALAPAPRLSIGRSTPAGAREDMRAPR